MLILRLFIIVVFACLISYCNQYTAEKLPINPVVLLGPPDGQTVHTKIKAIERIPNGGHIIRVAAQNAELLFQGYRIYEAATEQAVLSLPASAGIDCEPLYTFPVLGIIYTVEASTNPLRISDNFLCSFPINLTAGQYVSIRAKYLRGLGSDVMTSMPSNALIVPP
ncbi:MAG: hypothetical protein H3C43_04435 [Leptonema sp. (in: Bacteria)]|nr:hypothetical protein [Leptonema sp. (in: bacteria)]